MFRWTIKELETLSELEIIRRVLSERQNTCTNVYSPLYKKLQSLYNKADKLIQANKSKVEDYPSPYDSNRLSQLTIENEQLKDKLHRRNKITDNLRRQIEKLKEQHKRQSDWLESVEIENKLLQTFIKHKNLINEWTEFSRII